MGILSWIIFGLIAGAIAKAIHPGRDPQGCLITAVIGIVGAVIGGWIGTGLGWGTINGFNLRSFFLAVVGALVLLIIYNAFSRRPRV